MEGGLFQNAFWHPDGESLFAVEASGIQVRNPDDLTETYLIFAAPNRATGIGFTYSVWSPDGGSIASSTSDGQIYIWDAQNENILRVFTEHTSRVQKLAWSASLDLIASGDDSGTILIWNPTTGEIVAQLTGHTGAIRDLDWRADGQQIASAGADNTLRTWEWPSGEMQIVEGDSSIWSVAYSPDGSQLAYGGELSNPQEIAAQIKITAVATASPTPTETAAAAPTATVTLNP
jgi:WD40 repeat protein